MAERQGFEPWRPFWSLHAFQACAFDRSAISPLKLFTSEPSKEDLLDSFGAYPLFGDPFDRSAISPADLLEQGLPKKTKGEYDSPFEHEMVEMSGIEPLTFSLRTRRSPN